MAQHYNSVRHCAADIKVGGRPNCREVLVRHLRHVTSVDVIIAFMTSYLSLAQS